LTEAFVFEHRVRVEEVDAAGIVFFPRYFQWCHQAMATMLDAIEGGYAKFFFARRIGFPTVHAEADYRSPLRYGDAVRIDVVVERIGLSSCTLRFDLHRVGEDPRQVAVVRHVVVASDIDAMRSTPIPEDARAIFARYAPDATAGA
jgi:4-hydroxybenzoyl-CoA thioesterase